LGELAVAHHISAMWIEKKILCERIWLSDVFDKRKGGGAGAEVPSLQSQPILKTLIRAVKRKNTSKCVKIHRRLVLKK
jgi:hypothetical protein